AFPALAIQPQGFALVGMAAFFTGVVRAPVTGIVLVAEMTGNVTLLMPTLGACFVAMLLPMLLRNPPIYDSLREQTLRLGRKIHHVCRLERQPSHPSGSRLEYQIPSISYLTEGRAITMIARRR